jgi:hypothetical protein
MRISHLTAEFIAEDSIVVTQRVARSWSTGNSRSCVWSILLWEPLCCSESSRAAPFASSFAMYDLAARVLAGHRNRQITTILAGALLCG